MKQPRMWWAGDDKGWMIDTEVALTHGELIRSIEYTRTVQKDRFKTLRPGSMRDECRKTIEALDLCRVAQNIIGTGDKVLYDAYKSSGKKVFS